MKLSVSSINGQRTLKLDQVHILYPVGSHDRSPKEDSKLVSNPVSLVHHISCLDLTCRPMAQCHSFSEEFRGHELHDLQTTKS